MSTVESIAAKYGRTINDGSIVPKEVQKRSAIKQLDERIDKVKEMLNKLNRFKREMQKSNDSSVWSDLNYKAYEVMKGWQ